MQGKMVRIIKIGKLEIIIKNVGNNKGDTSNGLRL